MLVDCLTDGSYQILNYKRSGSDNVKMVDEKAQFTQFPHDSSTPLQATQRAGQACELAITHKCFTSMLRNSENLLFNHYLL